MKNNSTQIKPAVTKPAFNTSLIMIGENIRKRREALGMSQTELALATESQTYAISKYENGEREMGVTKLIAIADTLNVKPEVLLSHPQSNEEKVIALCQRVNALPEKARERIVGALELLMIGIENSKE